jgi:hypothetical protein
MNPAVVHYVAEFLLWVLFYLVCAFVSIRFAETDYAKGWHKKQLMELFEILPAIVMAFVGILVVVWLVGTCTSWLWSRL